MTRAELERSVEADEAAPAADGSSSEGSDAAAIEDSDVDVPEAETGGESAANPPAGEAAESPTSEKPPEAESSSSEQPS